jgi:CheY-like chemotaxis protein
MNVLVAEDSNVLNIVFKEILELINEKIKVFSARNYIAAKQILENNEINVALVDICLEDGDKGFEIVKNFSDKVPCMLIVSAYSEEYVRSNLKGYQLEFVEKNEWLAENIERFINRCMEKGLEKIEDSGEIEDNINNGMDDDIDFFDFDAELEDDEKELMNEYNESHGKIDAKTFLNRHPEKVKILSYAEELLNKIRELHLMDEDNYLDYQELIVEVLEEFSVLINDPLFDELNDVNAQLINIVESVNLEQLNKNKKNWYIKYLTSILYDIEDWLKNVFVEQIAVDVCYINASILNAVFELKNILETNC